jgi:3-dehydroquinate synthase
LESSPYAFSGSNAVTAIRVRAASSAHDMIVGAGLLHETGARVRSVMQGHCCAIISDSNVAPLFGDRIKRSLELANFQPTLITIPAGEKSKTLERASTICDQMAAAGLDRQSFVIALGGGMIGDISGFVAAIYHRGIPYVQIPTTLLAMVDSSIGGKTGVNTADGKNLIGAFHHPSLVVDDVEVLKTLPPREFNQGFAEVIKHAIIADAKMFEALKVARASGLRRASETHALQSLIKRNIEIKSKIVAKDERDQTGGRAILNFGHTIGHAIERAGDYRKFLHGEAISLGMVAACGVSVRKAGLPPDQHDAIVDLLRRFNLLTQLPKGFSREKIIETLKFDKKFEGGKVRFVVTPQIGAAQVSSDVTLDDIRGAIDEL